MGAVPAVIPKQAEVRIANAIIESTDTFSVMEQRLVYCAISKIPLDAAITEDSVFKISAREMVALGCNGDSVYRQMQATAKGLREHTITLANVDIGGTWYKRVNIGFARLATYDDEEACVGIAFDKLIIKYINLLVEKYTFFQLEDIQGFRSRYALKLYTLCMQRAHSRGAGARVKAKFYYPVEIDKLCRILAAPEGYDIDQLKRRIIEPVIKEINESQTTKIRISYKLDEESKIGKKYTKIIFTIRRRNDWQDEWEAIDGRYPFIISIKQKTLIASIIAGNFDPPKKIDPWTGEEYSNQKLRDFLVNDNVLPYGADYGLTRLAAQQEYFKRLSDYEFLDSAYRYLNRFGIYLRRSLNTNQYKNETDIEIISPRE